MAGLLQFVPSTGRPILHNDDGTVSTEESITVIDPRLNGGRPTNIPSIWGGQRYPDEDQAVEQALKSGQTFQAFDTIEDAVSAARARSEALGNEIDRTAPPYPSTGGNVISFHERINGMDGQSGSYPGLLNDPRMAALFGAGAGLLNAAGPHPYKVGLGEALGQGLGGAMSGMMGAEQYKADSEMRDMMKRFMEQQLGNGLFAQGQGTGAQQPPMPTSPLRPVAQQTPQMQPQGMQQRPPMMPGIMPTRGGLY